MRVLLTGGYGCIGAWITRQLLEAGHQVFILDLREELKRFRLIMDESQFVNITFLQGDVCNFERVYSALLEHAITHVIHLAGLQVPTCRANPILGAQVNVLGTLAVFEAVRRCGSAIERLVYASSAAVYGPPDRYPVGPLPDSAPLLPSTHYGMFKRCNEGNAQVYYLDHGLSSIGLRPWTVYGVGRDQGMTSEPTKAIKSLVFERPYHIRYGGYQDLQYVEDVAATFLRCLEVPFHGAKVYNLRGAVVDLPTFHRTLCEVEPKAADLITYGEQQITIAYDLSDATLQQDIGPIRTTSLAEGIRRTYEQFRRLFAGGQLDTSDLEEPKAPPVSTIQEA